MLSTTHISCYEFLYKEAITIYIVAIYLSKSQCICLVLFYMVVFRCFFFRICSAFGWKELDHFPCSSPRIHGGYSTKP